MRRKVILSVAMATSVFATASNSFAFGLECWTHGARHHADVTATATSAFSSQGKRMLQWVNDGLDIYINDPRIDVENYMKPMFDALHFDSLYSPSELANQHEKYMYGTMYGLMWAAENDDSSGHFANAAFHMLGVGLHAIQDFYSHSTWINAENRRTRDAFAYSRQSFINLGSALWTGRYDPTLTPLGRPSGPSYVHIHGANSTWTNIMNTLAGSCSCSAYDQGINLDRTCSANHGVRARGLSLSGAQALAAAKSVAQSASQKYLDRVGVAMTQLGGKYATFWNNLRTFSHGSFNPPAMGSTWNQSFFSKGYGKRGWVPFEFLSGGRYASPSGWYLRVEAATNNGTDSDISIEVNGTRYKLDRPSYNDFENGDNDAYHIGPISSQPTSIRLVKNGRWVDWGLSRFRVYAYRVGGQPMYGAIVDVSNIKLSGTTTRSFSVTAPRSINFSGNSLSWGTL